MEPSGLTWDAALLQQGEKEASLRFYVLANLSWNGYWCYGDPNQQATRTRTRTRGQGGQRTSLRKQFSPLKHTRWKVQVLHLFLKWWLEVQKPTNYGRSAHNTGRLGSFFLTWQTVQTGSGLTPRSLKPNLGSYLLLFLLLSLTQTIQIHPPGSKSQVPGVVSLFPLQLAQTANANRVHSVLLLRIRPNRSNWLNETHQPDHLVAPSPPWLFKDRKPCLLISHVYNFTCMFM